MLIYFDQLLTIRKTAKHHQDFYTLCVPLATLKGLPDIEDMKERERERERKQTERVETGKIREEIQQKRMMGKAFLAWPAALMGTFCHFLRCQILCDHL